jgi:drug/metabolite transporter (DMT)-like permease
VSSGRSNDTRIGFARCLAAAVLFGLSAPAASRLTGDLHPFQLAGLLYVGAAVAVAPFVVRRRPSRAALRASAPALAVAVVLGGAVGPVLLAAGLGRLDASTASLLLNLELVFTTLVAATLFREHVGSRVVVGTVFVLAGSVLLGWSGQPNIRWGAVLIAAACLCWAVDNSVTAAIDRLAPSHITAVKGVIAGSVNLGIGVSLAGVPGLGVSLAALVVGAFGYGASITLWVAGARQLGAARGQLVFATAPFIGAGAAWTVLGDAVTLTAAVATAIGACGVLLVIRSSHLHEHAHELRAHDHDHSHDDGHHQHDHEASAHDLPEGGRHAHPHEHEPTVHRHPHVPDLHHRHGHTDLGS